MPDLNTVNIALAQCPCPATSDLFPLVVVVLAVWGIFQATKGISGWIVRRKGKEMGSGFHKVLTFVLFVLIAGAVMGGAGLLAALNPSTGVQLEPAARPRLVFLGAGMCSACQEMEPVREYVRDAYADKLVVNYHDVMKNSERGKQFRISSIPATIYFAPDGSELLRREGYLSAHDIAADWHKLGYKIETDYENSTL